MNIGRRPMLVLMPLAWLAVVLVVAGLTWQVIDSAGRDVLASGEPPPLSAAGTTPGGGDDRDGPRSGGASVGATGTPSPTPRPSGSAEPRPSPSSRTGGPSAAAAPSSSSTAPPTQPAPTTGQTVVRSWQGTAGTVAAACSGSSISLQSATPNDGWVIEVDDRGPGRVRVELTSRGEDEQETRVEAVCAGGAPTFDVETKD